MIAFNGKLTGYREPKYTLPEFAKIVDVPYHQIVKLMKESEVRPRMQRIGGRRRYALVELAEWYETNK